MKHFFKPLRLVVCLLLCLVGGVGNVWGTQVTTPTTGITDVSGSPTRKVYTFTCCQAGSNKGKVWADSNGSISTCSSSTATKFLFEASTTSGAYYLRSLESNKYMYRASDANNAAVSLSDTKQLWYVVASTATSGNYLNTVRIGYDATTEIGVNCADTGAKLYTAKQSENGNSWWIMDETTEIGSYYTVSITGAPSGSTATVTYDGTAYNSGATNIPVFGTPTTSDFTASTISGYTPKVEISGTSVTVTYYKDLVSGNVYSIKCAYTDVSYPIATSSSVPQITRDASAAPQYFVFTQDGTDTNETPKWTLKKAEGDGNYLAYVWSDSKPQLLYSVTASDFEFINNAVPNASSYSMDSGTLPSLPYSMFVYMNGTNYYSYCGTSGTTFNGWTRTSKLYYQEAESTGNNCRFLVEEAPYTVYSVVVSGADGTVTYTNNSDVAITRTSQGNNGFFAISNSVTPTASMFAGSVVSGYNVSSIDVNTENKKITVTYTAEAPGTILFNNSSSSVPYCIPAIAQNKDGYLLAVGDYRKSGKDIGQTNNNGGEVDIMGRISTNNGASWGDEITIADGDGSGTYASYGDAAVVADRESGKFLLMSCYADDSGNQGFWTGAQGSARFISTDNGSTWTRESTLTAQNKKDLMSGTYGSFFSSGRICQSNIIKKSGASYYRIYSALCTCTSAGTSGGTKTWVLYSDDFGATWNVLGSGAAVSCGNESKIEELPDGRVLVSCRVYNYNSTSNGRLFNIFTYTDSENGEGSWGTAVQENSVIASGDSGTDGEILFVPAKDASNNDVIVALQSAPAGSGRNNVTIYYKVLGSDYSKYNNPTNFAKSTDWAVAKKISSTTSAYSTMILQKDNTIGFFYEETAYTQLGDGGYNLTYKNFALSDLVSGYTVNTSLDRKAFVTAYFNSQKAAEGTSWTTGQVSVYNTLIANLSATPTAAQLDALHNFMASPYEGTSYTINYVGTVSGAEKTLKTTTVQSESVPTASDPNLFGWTMGSQSVSGTTITVPMTNSLSGKKYLMKSTYNNTTLYVKFGGDATLSSSNNLSDYNALWESTEDDASVMSFEPVASDSYGATWKIKDETSGSATNGHYFYAYTWNNAMAASTDFAWTIIPVTGGIRLYQATTEGGKGYLGRDDDDKFADGEKLYNDKPISGATPEGKSSKGTGMDFVLEEYNPVTVTPVVAEGCTDMGSVSVSGKTVTATANSGNKFTKWTWTENDESKESTDNPYTYTGSTDVTITAYFESRPEKTVKVINNDSKGTVTITCDGETKSTNEEFSAKGDVVLKPSSSTHSLTSFTDGTGNTITDLTYDSSAGTYTYTGDADVTIQANWSVSSSTLDIPVSGTTGDLSKKDNQYYNNVWTYNGTDKPKLVIETTYVTSGFYYASNVFRMYGNGSTSTNSRVYTMTIPEPYKITGYDINFQAYNTYGATIYDANNDSKTSSSSTDQKSISCTLSEATSSTTYSINSTVSAIINSMTVHYKNDGATYKVTLNAGTGGTAAFADGTTVKYVDSNEEITATAVNSDDYAFVSWTNASGTVVSNDAEYTFTPTEETALTANFKLAVNNPKFVYIKGYNDGLYISCNNTGGDTGGTGSCITMTSNQNISSLFYYDKNFHLISCSTGFSLGSTSHANINRTAPAEDDWTTWSLTVGGTSQLVGTLSNGTTYYLANNNVMQYSPQYEVTEATSASTNNSYKWTTEEATSIPVTFNSAALGYATFCAPVAVNIPNGVNAYVCMMNGSTLNMYKIAGIYDSNNTLSIPANTPVMLYNSNYTGVATQDMYIATGVTETIEKNSFYGTTEAETLTSGYNWYSLQKKSSESKVGFYRKTNGSLGGFKAWLRTASTDARTFTINFDGEDVPTGLVEALGLENENVEIYDLNGRKLQNYQKGINITNGKKVIR